MQFLRPDPFPVATALELLALCRRLYVAWRAEDGTTTDRLRRLESAGLDLRLAIDAVRSMPFAGTPQQASAWFVAERAVRTLGELVSAETELGEAVLRVASRVAPPGGRN